MAIDKFQIEFETLLSTLVDGVIIINAKGEVQLMNPAAETIFGYPHAEVIGQNVKMLMPEPYESEHDGYIDAHLKTGIKKIIGIGREVEGRRKDGSIFPMELSVGKTMLDGEPLFVGVTRDLSTRYERQREYETLKEQHYHLSRVSAMNQMGSAIAHEINQPMAASLNYMETAKILIDRGEAIDTVKLSAILEDAIEQTERATEIVSRMRRFIQSGEGQREPLRVETIVESSIKLAFLGIDRSAIKLTHNFDQPLPPVEVDNVQIQQVLINLVKNACEAMEGTAQKSLAISAKVADCGNFVEIAVHDTGHGLSEGDAMSLFVPFASSKSTGLGVGLSISQSIVTQHGGQLWYSPNKPQGSIFYFTVPIVGAPS